MASRLELHEELCELQGTRNVYFQPPENVKLKYPCTIYGVTGSSDIYGSDKLYRGITRYQLIVVDPDPDVSIALKDKYLHHFQMCSFDRAYTSDNLYHNVLSIYY